VRDKERGSAPVLAARGKLARGRQSGANQKPCLREPFEWEENFFGALGRFWSGFVYGIDRQTYDLSA